MYLFAGLHNVKLKRTARASRTTPPLSGSQHQSFSVTFPIWLESTTTCKNQDCLNSCIIHKKKINEMQILMYPDSAEMFAIERIRRRRDTDENADPKQTKWNKVMSISLRTGFKSRFLYFSSSTHFCKIRWNCRWFYSGLFCRLFDVGSICKILICWNRGSVFWILLRVDYAKRAINIDLIKTHIISISIKRFPRNFC